MSASLVGSEMCIRDSSCTVSPGGLPPPWTAKKAPAAPCATTPERERKKPLKTRLQRLKRLQRAAGA
eukprot:13096068-Alexandrium_andersonii.AAC.1